MTTKFARSYSGRTRISAYVDETGGWRDILDCIIRHVHVADPAPVPSAPIDDEIPWVDCPTPTKSIELLPPMQADNCVLVFSDDMRAPVPVSFTRGATIDDLLMAHAQLVGSFQVARIAGRDGSPVSLSHVLDVGSLAIVHVCTGWSCLPENP